MKRVILGLTIAFFLVGAGFVLFPRPLIAEDMVDVGNKFCPVSGDKVSGKHFMVYNGKRYGMCCHMCEAKFKKHPEKYLAKMASQEAEHEHHHDHDHDEHMHG